MDGIMMAVRLLVAEGTSFEDVFQKCYCTQSASPPFSAK